MLVVVCCLLSIVAVAVAVGAFALVVAVAVAVLVAVAHKGLLWAALVRIYCKTHEEQHVFTSCSETPATSRSWSRFCGHPLGIVET